MFDVIESGLSVGAVQRYLVQMVVLLLSLCIHEYSHARTAYRLGDSTAQEAGRLSLNPLAHLDFLGTLLILAGAPIGWAKPVPVNPARFRRDVDMKKGMAKTSLAGPVSNLILALIAWFALDLTRLIANISRVSKPSFSYDLVSMLLLAFYLMFFTNLYLAIFNLLPVPPLDGSRIWSTLLPDRYYNTLMRYERYIGLAFLAIVLFFPRGLGRVLNTVAYPLIWIIQTPLDLLFGWLATLI